MLNIKTDRPLVFFDLETTGTNPNFDKIVEISVLKILPDGSRETKTRLINPGMHIPEEATKIHGIKDEDVAGAPGFKAIAKNLYIYLEGADLGGYNIMKFDIPLLTKEFSDAGLSFSMEGRRVLDPYQILCKMEPRNLSSVYKMYCGKDLENAHSSEHDTAATVEVFMAQMEKYPELPKDIGELHEMFKIKKDDWLDSTGKFKWAGDTVIVGFGKNSGQPLRKIAGENPEFLRWIISRDFPEDAKKIASDAIKGVFPSKGEKNLERQQ